MVVAQMCVCAHGSGSDVYMHMAVAQMCVCAHGSGSDVCMCTWQSLRCVYIQMVVAQMCACAIIKILFTQQLLFKLAIYVSCISS
jgi:hypothetical protein